MSATTIVKSAEIIGNAEYATEAVQHAAAARPHHGLLLETEICPVPSAIRFWCVTSAFGVQTGEVVSVVGPSGAGECVVAAAH